MLSGTSGAGIVVRAFTISVGVPEEFTVRISITIAVGSPPKSETRTLALVRRPVCLALNDCAERAVLLEEDSLPSVDSLTLQ
jgi:hypothetical protein